MSNVIIMTSGTSFASQADPMGVAIPLRYALPIYDYRFDPFVLSANVVPASAAEPTSASNGSIFGEIIYNTETLGGAYVYSMTSNRMLISAAGQAGTTSITGNPFNATSYMNLMNGRPLSPVVSGTSMTYSAGTWAVSSPVSRAYNGTSATPTGWASRMDKYFQVVSFAPIVSAAGGQARGLYKVRFGNELGTFKFNKIGLYLARYTISAGVDTSVEPVLYAIATLPNGPVIKTNDGSNITYFEADVEVLLSASNYFSQVSYVNNTEFNRYAGDQAIYWDGDVAFGSSAVPGSFRGPAKINITEHNPAKPIMRFTRDNSADYLNIFYNGASSSAPQVEFIGPNANATLKWNGAVSAHLVNTKNLLVSASLNVNDNFSVDSTGIVVCDSVIYTEFLEVYQTATVGESLDVGTDLTVGESLTLGQGATMGGNIVINHGQTGLPIIQITSAGLVSAGGGNGSFFGDSGNFDNLIVEDNADVFGDLSVYSNTYLGGGGSVTLILSDNTLINNSLNVSGATKLASDLTVYGTTLVQGLNVGGNASVTGQANIGGQTTINAKTFLNRDVQIGGTTVVYHGQTEVPVVNITSAGVISAGGGNGTVYSDNGVFYNTLFTDTVNVSGALRIAGDVNLDGGSLCTRSAIVTATGSGPYAAACGSAIAGRVRFSSTVTADTYITVYTTAVTTDSIILLTPIRNNSLIGPISLDTGIVNEVQFDVHFNSMSSTLGLQGFNFLIINMS